MPNKKKNSQRKLKKRQGNGTNVGPAPYRSMYGFASSQGVIQFGHVTPNTPISRERLRLVVTGLTSDAGGLIAIKINLNDPSTATNWSSYATLFDQYRVKKLVVSIIPDLDPTTITVRPLYAVTDYDSNSVASLTTADICMQYEDSVAYDITKQIQHTVIVPPYLAGSSPVGWLDVANVLTSGYLAFMAYSLTASTQYLSAFVATWEVEFRKTR